MIVRYSKEFAKSMDRLSGKLLKSVVAVINEVIDATSIDEITDCKKIESLNSVYRIRIGDRRAFFVLHVEIEGDVVKFEYLVSRGEAYENIWKNCVCATRKASHSNFGAISAAERSHSLII